MIFFNTCRPGEWCTGDPQPFQKTIVTLHSSAKILAAHTVGQVTTCPAPEYFCIALLFSILTPRHLRHCA